MAAYVSGERRNFDRDAPAGAGSGEFDIRRHARLGALGFERQERFRRTPNENAYAYAPLSDTSDNVISVALSGLQTLRLTGSEVTPGMQADFLIAGPDGTAIPAEHLVQWRPSDAFIPDPNRADLHASIQECVE